MTPLVASTHSHVSKSLSEGRLFRRFAQTRGVWLRSRAMLPTRSTARLMNLPRCAGMELDVLAYSDLYVIPFWRYDLIVLEQSHTESMSDILASVKRVRALSNAPLVVLMRRVDPETIIAGLTAGADAVSSLQAPKRALLAQWCAMLGRWKMG